MINLLKQRDKQGHFLVGLVFSAIVSMALQSAWEGFALGVLLGALKEAYDATDQEHHTVDVWDFVATGIGAGSGALLVWSVFL